MPRPPIWRYAWISVGAAIVTTTLKAAAWRLSGSVGLGSDAAEGFVNLVAAGTTLLLVRWASQPADDEHPWGHGKAEHVAAAFEGVLILAAAVGIVISAVDRLLHPRPVAALGGAALLAGLATVINGAVGSYLVRVGRRHRSSALEADGQHLLTDVWNSIGVLVGVGLVAWTGRLWIDALCAAAVAVSIALTAWPIVRRAASGLLDERLDPEEEAAIRRVVAGFRAEGVEVGSLRTRRSGAARHVTLHVLVPGGWSVAHGHDVCDRIEASVGGLFPETHVLTHLEPAPEP
jgi:cation diffusion facilitator family transporter